MKRQRQTSIQAIFAEATRQLHRYQDQTDMAELLTLDEEELRARKRAHQRQSRLIRRVLRARKGGA